MYTASKNVYRERIDFAKIKTSIPIPNLIEIQKNSYERFLQMRVLPGEREDAGLQSVFKSVFPITDLRENCSLEFVDYAIGNWECKCGRLVGLDKLGRPCTFCGATLITDPRGDREIHCLKCGHLNENIPITCETCDEPVGLKLKYDVDECQERGMTFAVPLKVTIRLVVWDKDPETGAKTIRDIKEQEVYYGDIPLMTENGTFIINGTERVIVSQLHRSPGVFFSQPEKGLFAAQIIPYRGSWVEFEYDSKNLLHVRIDRKRKFLASVFLRAMGLKSANKNDSHYNPFRSIGRVGRCSRRRVSFRQGRGDDRVRLPACLGPRHRTRSAWRLPQLRRAPRRTAGRHRLRSVLRLRPQDLRSPLRGASWGRTSCCPCPAPRPRAVARRAGLKARCLGGTECAGDRDPA